MLLTTVAIASATPAAAATFRVEPHGVVVSGDIVAGDADRLSRAVRDAPVPIVFVDSPGGVLRESVWMADVIRGAKATVVVSGTCASACFNLFVAGHGRVVLRDSRVGVHSVGLVGKQGHVTASSRMSIALSAYLVARGVPWSIVAKMLATPPSRMAWLTRSDLEKLDAEIVD